MRAPGAVQDGVPGQGAQAAHAQSLVDRDHQGQLVGAAPVAVALVSSRGVVALPGVPNADLYQDRWAAWWYGGRRLDPGHQWLVATLRTEAAGLPALTG